MSRMGSECAYVLNPSMFGNPELITAGLDDVNTVTGFLSFDTVSPHMLP